MRLKLDLGLTRVERLRHGCIDGPWGGRIDPDSKGSKLNASATSQQMAKWSFASGKAAALRLRVSSSISSNTTRQPSDAIRARQLPSRPFARFDVIPVSRFDLPLSSDVSWLPSKERANQSGGGPGHQSALQAPSPHGRRGRHGEATDLIPFDEPRDKARRLRFFNKVAQE